MAEGGGGYFTGHVPAIGGAIQRGDQQADYWKPFFDSFPPLRQWLGKVRPDVGVVFSNDDGLNVFLDAMRSFAVDAAEVVSTMCQSMKAGTQGVEIFNSIAARGALRDAPQTMVMRTYHVPISNTAAASVVLEPALFRPSGNSSILGIAYR